MAQELHEWGIITTLSKTYSISRQFIYSLIEVLKVNLPQLFSPKIKQEIISKKELFSKMLSYRMKGRCSIETISTLMKREESSLSSIGMISQTLYSQQDATRRV